MENYFDFDLGDLFSGLGFETYNYPPYDLEQTSDTTFRLVLAVAGFKQDQIEINTEGRILNVKGSKVSEDVENSEKGIKVIRRGIAKRGFDLKFTLQEYVEVDEVTLEHGLLVINLVRNIPETAKPRVHEIKTK